MSRIVPAPDALVGKRFDVAVAKMLGISRSKAADLVDSGQARVLGREVARSSTLQAGETVEFDLAEEQAEPEPIATDMAVVYEDDDVVVVDKPVGVAAHASVGWTGPTVLGSLRDRGVHITSYGAAGREGIVSRLDVGTSGLMLVCKSDLAYTEMRRQFAEHEVKKTYHALVQGGLKENKATIEAPIGRAKVSDFRFCVTPAGGAHRLASPFKAILIQNVTVTVQLHVLVMVDKIIYIIDKMMHHIRVAYIWHLNWMFERSIVFTVNNPRAKTISVKDTYILDQTIIFTHYF